jgi:excisionase family DNA binding protein
MKKSYDRTPPTTDPLDEILTLKQVAEYLKCHTGTLYRLVKHGRVPHFRIGSGFRFQKSTIDNWIRKNTSVKVRA